MSLFLVCVIFFFKQKAAYEVRISDWSSDVYSSDLRGLRRVAARRRDRRLRPGRTVGGADLHPLRLELRRPREGSARRLDHRPLPEEIGRASGRARVGPYA